MGALSHSYVGSTSLLPDIWIYDLYSYEGPWLVITLDLIQIAVKASVHSLQNSVDKVMPSRPMLRIPIARTDQHMTLQ